MELLGFLLLAVLALCIRTVLKAKEQQDQLDKALREISVLQRGVSELNARLKALEPTVEQPLPLVLPPPKGPAVAAVPGTFKPPAPKPPPLPDLPAPRELPPTLPGKTIKAPLNLEQFIGGKLLAWVGGLVLFLGVIFFVKLSIERGWLPPGLRVLIGFATGLGLLGGGWWSQRWQRYTVLAHTLCATGVVVLYGVSYAAHALYRIPPLDHALVTFGLMSLITVTAFGLAVRLDARVIAVLGMLGGFLTPLACSTGKDNPFGLFSYIGLLDIGVLALVARKRWRALTMLAAVGTMLMECGWLGRFYEESHYAEGAATWIPVGVFLGFAALFAAAALWRRVEPEGAGPALALCGSAMAAGFLFVGTSSIQNRPWVLYPFVLGICLIVLVLVWQKPRLASAYSIFTGLTFLHLIVWTRLALTPSLLPWALAVYLGFGLMQAGFAWLVQGKNPNFGSFVAWVPLVSLLLMLLPLFWLPSPGFMIWPAVLLSDLVVIGLALRCRSFGAVMAALLMTLLAAGVWLWRGHEAGGDEAGLPTVWLWVVGGFALVFSGAGTWLARRFPEDPAASPLPGTAVVMPFVLLGLAVNVLKIPDPSPVFLLAGVLAGFLLLLSRSNGREILAPLALACVLGLEAAWHLQTFQPGAPLIPLLWYLGFQAVFTAWPFGFRQLFAEKSWPWITSAAAGAGTFPLVYQLVKLAWPHEATGLIPAGFAVAPLLGLTYVVKNHQSGNPARITQLAWFAGVALGFLTLIIPLQYHRQWITLGWALEGAALCWLFRRVPHPGLRGLGAVLLAVAFIRLALNPAVLSYQIRGPVPVWNWQLYAYSVAAGSLFAAAAFLRPPTHLWAGLNLRSSFTTMGVVLLFLLLNIEIADAFTLSGARSLTFEFDGNFGRDMTYTISWALFALGLLGIGFWKHQPPVRYAGIGLLAAALLKLFVHDLDNIGSGYRIGAFMIVAIIALVASFLYQRFLTDGPK